MRNKYKIFNIKLLIETIRENHLRKKQRKMPVADFLKKEFKIKLGYKLDLRNPRSFNEKLQWIKLYYHDPKMVEMADKFLVRQYVEKTIGKKYLIPLISTYSSVDEIDFDSLPNSFVLKCNHNSGIGMVVCKSKDGFDVEKAKKELMAGMNEDYYLKWYEWPYKDIKRMIVCEEYLGDNNGRGLQDYKFYCFDGKPTYLLISSNRMVDVNFDYYDIDLNKLPFSQGGKRTNQNVCEADIPNFKKMVDIASKLAFGFPHVRVDLYNINGKIYFGEMTFFDGAGFSRFSPRKWDFIFGESFTLPNKLF